MLRLYSPSKNIFRRKIIIDENNDQFHHAKNVLRLKVDDEVIIFDDKKNEYQAILEKILPKSIIFNIKYKENFIPNPSRVKITVACAIPKASHMDDIIDKLTQLGVDRIIPLETERVIVKLDKHKKILRQQRWNKIALNASQQSQRNTLPILEPVKKIKEFLSDSGSFDLKLIPALIGQRKPLKEALKNSKPKNILVMIGPEGDFTPGELELAEKAGCIPVTLGDLVLRVETAAVAVAGFIRLYYDES